MVTKVTRKPKVERAVGKRSDELRSADPNDAFVSVRYVAVRLEAVGGLQDREAQSPRRTDDPALGPHCHPRPTKSWCVDGQGGQSLVTPTATSPPPCWDVSRWALKVRLLLLPNSRTVDSPTPGSPYMPEECSYLVHEKFRLLEGGEVTTPRGFVPVSDIEEALFGPSPGRSLEFLGEDRAPNGSRDSVSDRARDPFVHLSHTLPVEPDR